MITVKDYYYFRQAVRMTTWCTSFALGALAADPTAFSTDPKRTVTWSRVLTSEQTDFLREGSVPTAGTCKALLTSL